MRTWRKAVKACLKYAVVNVVLVFLMLATTFLQVLPPAIAASPSDTASKPADTTENADSKDNDTLPIDDMASEGQDISIPQDIADQILPDEHVPVPDTLYDSDGNLLPAEQEKKNASSEHSKVSGKVDPDKDADIELDSATKKITLHLPKGAVDKEAQVEIVDHGSQGSKDDGMLSVFELNALPITKETEEVDNLSKITHFNQNLSLSIQHTPEDLAGLDTNTLKLYYLDENASQWIPVPDSKFDPVTNTLTATTDHFSYYGEVAVPIIAGPGKVLGFNTNLHAGAAVYSYPIDSPAGAGGFKPNINLIYNSASVDEMKNKRDVGSWVGIGWSLSMGSIQYDSATDEYSITFDGVSYTKINHSVDHNYYVTNPQSFYKITRAGDTWQVYDREGIKYQFGGTSDSGQYYNDDYYHNDRTYYRWDLSSITDTSGNRINISYVQDIFFYTLPDDTNKWCVRAAYPQHVKYNNGSVDIVFNSNYDSYSWDSGPLRADNPRLPEPGPQVIDDRHLDSIEVKVDGNLSKKYAFSYDCTWYYPSEDYGDVDYAGTLKLTSITEKGSDGTSSLPALSFSYSDKQICLYDSAHESYPGNPGNPATLTWPYLTSATNGYGATVTYSYSQIPFSWDCTSPVWSREIVTGMSVNPGNGITQTYSYNYGGYPSPSYLSGPNTPWDDEYRGFPYVRVTDAEGNYVNHWFWTTGSDDAETLTGMEYRTYSYNASNQMLEKKDLTWAYNHPAYGGLGTPFVYLKETTDNMGSKTSRNRYEYDAYGNMQRQYLDGDINVSSDDMSIVSNFSPNSSVNILSKIAKERIYDQASTLKKENWYFYDGSDNVSLPPAKGYLTTARYFTGDGGNVSTSYTYDTYGNVVTETDAKGTTWYTYYDAIYHTFPVTISVPIVQQSESYTFNSTTGNLLSRTDVNGQITSYDYDIFGRIIKVIKPGDNSSSPSIQYQYNNWGTLGQQHLKTLTKVNTSDYLWSSQYFDGIGRVIQTQSSGEPGYTIIDSTTVYNNCGLVAKTYVSQNLSSAQVNGYKDPTGWKYSSAVYDGLGRMNSTTAADGTTTTTDYSVPWQQTVNNSQGYKHTYYYDAFGRLATVQELNSSQGVYATTNYSYDTLGNLIRVVDNSQDTISMTYDWLGRKTSMSDPDMGSWSYWYDKNGNLVSQTDAKQQTVTLTYDALNRLTAKRYPSGSGMTNVSYTYDSFLYGTGHRTGMTDAAGTTTYKYDNRSRLIQEKRTIAGTNYVTNFSYDAGDRLKTVTYPTGENVTQTYNGRGLPNTLNGSVVGNLVTNTSYNQLGQITRINLGNGDFDTYAYYGLDTGAPSGYWGRLWEIKTSNASAILRDVQYTWDANGNMIQRQDARTQETENFTYDFLDRITSVSGAYNQNYTYNTIGNILSMNGISYSYTAKPHAVTSVGSTSYTYDANGNMRTRGSQTITWDMANMPVSITTGSNTSTFVYDGDGNRVKKTEGGQTTVYVNQYYEKNITTGNVTTHYYLGGKEVAYKTSNNLRYVHQDSLSSTSVTTSSTGAVVASVKYFPFGGTRSTSGTLDTDKLFTGQRLDQTGLYFYNARYYDATIGRFISPDSTGQSLTNPQTLNRYSYCLNNPLKYVDPSGHEVSDETLDDYADTIEYWDVDENGDWEWAGPEGTSAEDYGYSWNSADGTWDYSAFGGEAGVGGTEKTIVSKPGTFTIPHFLGVPYDGSPVLPPPGTLDPKVLASLNVQLAPSTIGHKCTRDYCQQCNIDSIKYGASADNLWMYNFSDIDCKQCMGEVDQTNENYAQIQDQVEGAGHSSVDVTNSYYWFQSYNYYQEVTIGSQ